MNTELPIDANIHLPFGQTGQSQPTEHVACVTMLYYLISRINVCITLLEIIVKHRYWYKCSICWSHNITRQYARLCDSAIVNASKYPTRQIWMWEKVLWPEEFRRRPSIFSVTELFLPPSFDSRFLLYSLNVCILLNLFSVLFSTQFRIVFNKQMNSKPSNAHITTTKFINTVKLLRL